MRVKATRIGYYGHRRRREGEVFDLAPRKILKDGKEVVLSPEQQFSNSWMEKVTKLAKGKAKAEPEFVEEETEADNDQEVI
jgi:hypothetical protein